MPLLILTLAFCARQDCFAAARGYVRVLVLRDAASASLRVNGDYSIIDPSGGNVLYGGSDLYTTVTVQDSRILFGEQRFAAPKIMIVPREAEAIVIDGRRFRGNMLFARDRSRISAVNYIGLEDYIRGVLYHEVSHYWPDEALKAQAITTRTYALYQMTQNAAREFDVTNDIYSQVYGGRTSERYRLDRAQNATTGQVLVYQGNLLPAFFHAACGGATEDVSELWSLDLAPLKGVQCPFCKDSPHFNWHYVISLKDIREKLNASGIACGFIKDIFAAGRNNSGRVRILRIVPEQGASDVEIKGKDFRNIIGPNIMRSLNFKVYVSGTDAVFEGLGWGHGVGFCQWGGYFLAKRGDNHEEILKYYYPGAVIARRPKADEAIPKP